MTHPVRRAIAFLLFCTVMQQAAHAQLHADFTASPASGCAPLFVSFHDQSTGNPSSWEWDLGDGTVSNQQNPVHVYTAPGNYNVILRITNSTGCTSTFSRQQYIKINDGVKAGFSFVNTNLCKPPALVNFTNSSTGTGTL